MNYTLPKCPCKKMMMVYCRPMNMKTMYLWFYLHQSFANTTAK